MQPTYTAEAETYREKVQAFLAEKLPHDWKGIGALNGDEITQFVGEWRAILADARYLAPGWPAEYGGGGRSLPTRDTSHRAGPPSTAAGVCRRSSR
jgi:alkylation response protein AidB-like acyl-CoA dehydrogenase